MRELALDVGCKDGLITDVHSSAIELDMERQECLIPLVVGDMHKLPFKSNVFDTVLFSHTLEHTAFPDVVLAETYRVLKQGGKIIIVVPNARFFLWPLYKITHGYAYGKDHDTYFTCDSLKTLLNKAHFTLTKTKTSAIAIPKLLVETGLFSNTPLRKLAQKISNFNSILSLDLIYFGVK